MCQIFIKKIKNFKLNTITSRLVYENYGHIYGKKCNEHKKASPNLPGATSPSLVVSYLYDMDLNILYIGKLSW